MRFMFSAWKVSRRSYLVKHFKRKLMVLHNFVRTTNLTLQKKLGLIDFNKEIMFTCETDIFISFFS